MTDIDLLTVEDRVRLLVNALADDQDPVPVVKLFTPDAGATWLLVQCDPDEPDRVLALCDLALGHPELGWIHLAEIKEIRGHLGLPVERDLHFTADKPISAYAAEARAKGRIVA
ncbi:hypothetical protein ACVWWI_000164 [Bradyrhizobium sp. USDA 3686]|uniref:DUF2958 domain-containing protein n=1 Tax=Bradyrhizobium canariense TaxID=255045 RepID=UPI00195A72FB|nr:DUF2958 domain-containing protein [Bradyrhizobium canariense]MBM7486719.1 hypothetical protein [Bradyrhizobium canariense]